MTKIKYKEGWLYVDTETKVKVGDYAFIPMSNRVELVTDKNVHLADLEYKIVAQSPNLSLPNIPYIEEVDEIENMVRKLTNKHSLNGWEQNGVRIGYKAAQSKGGYSEADKLAIAWNVLEWVGFKRGEEFTDENVLTQLQSLNQSKEIEIEMKDWCDYDDDNPCGGLDKPDLRPVTYQKDGKTFLKVKS